MKLIQGIVAPLLSIGLLTSSVVNAAGITIDISAQVNVGDIAASINDIKTAAQAAAPLSGVPIVPVYGDRVGATELPPLLQSPNAFALGDLDGDGDQDMAVADPSWGLQFSFNNDVESEPTVISSVSWAGSGTFPVERIKDYQYSDIVIADFNNDSKQDVIAVSLDGPSLVLINAGNHVVDYEEEGEIQSFSMPSFYIYEAGAYLSASMREHTSSVDVGDVNGDGLLDVVFGNIGEPNRVILNDFDGDTTANPLYGGVTYPEGYVPNVDNLTQLEWFEQEITQDSYNTVDIKLVDLNKDGFLDVVSVNENAPSSRAVTIAYHNQSQDPYDETSIVKYISSSTKAPNKVTAADYDKDGYIDLVIATNKNDPGFYLYQGESGYRFTLKEIKKPFNADISAISSSDVNLDGYIDLIVSFNDSTGEHENVTQVYLNDRADFSFSSTSGITIGSDAASGNSSIGIADIDLDGFSDIVLGNTDESDPTIYFKQLINDELPPQVEITGIFDNAVIELPDASHQVVISAVDHSGINSIFARAYLKENLENIEGENAYGNPIELINKQNGEVYSQEYSFEFVVSDGQEYKIELVITDRAGNSYTDTLEYEFTDNIDLVDSDGDQMLDSWEVKHGFNPLNSSDSDDDKDEDGLSNVEEFVAKTDPEKSDSDSDGYSDYEETVYGTNPLFTHPRPMAEFSVDQFVDEGSEITVDVYLRTNAAVYPVVINIEIASESTALEGADFEIDTLELVINEGRKGSFNLSVVNDGVAEGREDITLRMIEVEHAILGVKEDITLTIIEENISPEVNLVVMQGSRTSRVVALNSGVVSLVANLRDVNSSDSHIVDWDFANELGVVQVSADARSASFDPANVGAGLYRAEVTVTDNGSSALSTTSYIDIKVVESAKTEEELLDDNDNGIVNAFDRASESYQLPARDGSGAENLISTFPGLKLNIGATSLSGVANDAEVTLAEIKAYMTNQTTQSMDDEKFNIGGYFDFDVSGLPFKGMTVDIVIPLKGELPKNAVYRKFNPLNGWSDFAENELNRVSSARSEDGLCPPAGSDKYQLGAIVFNQCLQLSIEDGGPNDMDGVANGVIRDPGGIAIEPDAVEEEEELETASSGGGGGGSADEFLLMLLVIGAMWRRKILARR